MSKRDDATDAFDERWHLECWPELSPPYEADHDGYGLSEQADDGWPPAGLSGSDP